MVHSTYTSMYDYNYSCILGIFMTNYLFWQEEKILFRDAHISYIVTQPSMDVYEKMERPGCFSDDDSYILLRMIQGKGGYTFINQICDM